jgi:hypothetical protein
MKIIINNVYIHIYNVHGNNFYNKDCGHEINVPGEPLYDLSKDDSLIIVNDSGQDKEDPLIAQLQKRILQSENQVKQLRDKHNIERTEI